MRALKLARQRRDLSPDQYRFALHSTIALNNLTFKGMAAFRLRTMHSKRGYPSLQIIILLDNSSAAAEAVELLSLEFTEIDNLYIIVTYCDRTFWSICSIDETDRPNSDC